MRHLLHHPPKHGSVRPLHYLVELAQSQTLHHQLLFLRRADRAAIQLNLDRPCHYSFSGAIPRISATAAFSRSDSSATIVAFTTLCGFRRPIDFVSTFGTPQAVMTARTAPPAITPVPAGAGFSSTWLDAYSPNTWCGIVVSSTWTLRNPFFAASMPLRMADGTSFALPTPYPTTFADGSPI